MLKLIIPYDPVPASRPRTGKWGGYYTGRYRQWREDMPAVMDALLPSNWTVIDSPCSVSLYFYKTRPKNPTHPYPRGDVDNYIKAMFDIMNGRVFTDDNIATYVEAFKAWAPEGQEGYIEVIITWETPES